MLTLPDILAAGPSKSDAEVADAYNAQLPVYRAVPVAEINAMLSTRMLNGRLRVAASNPALPDSLRVGIYDLLATLDNYTVVDATVPEFRGAIEQVMGGLVQAGVIADDDAAAFGSLMVDPAYTAATPADVRLLRFKAAKRLADDAMSLAFDAEPTQPPAALAAVYAAKLVSVLTPGQGAK